MEFLVLIILILAFSSSASQSYRKELRTKNEIKQNVIQQFENSTQPVRVDPSQVIQLSWRPRLFLYRSFLSDEECNHLISLAHGNPGKSLVENFSSRNIVNSSNQHTTSVTSLGIEGDDTVARIEERISAWTFLPKENSEPVKIRQYANEDTKESLDYSGKKGRLESAAPLMAAVVLYLSNVTHGGETLFLKSELKNTQPKDDTWSDCAKKGYAVKPIRGNALLIFGLQLNISPDETSSNSICPVLQGEKWFATKLFHLGAINEKKPLSESASDDCIDEEDSCPYWAAQGECEKNPHYMT
ncbi:Prolyl 4-hydroxylase alpha subunit protein, partial [Thalictrum thalictroides]